MKLLMSSLPKEQQNRYEVYGRSAFLRGIMKRPIRRAALSTVSPVSERGHGHVGTGQGLHQGGGGGGPGCV